jgi:hypothetical protein
VHAETEQFPRPSMQALFSTGNDAYAFGMLRSVLTARCRYGTCVLVRLDKLCVDAAGQAKDDPTYGLTSDVLTQPRPYPDTLV